MPPLSTSACLPDFPQAIGNRMVSLIDHKGPASYAALAPGTPPTGGDVLTAAECGMKFISAVSGQVDSTGTYTAEATETVGSQGEVTQVRLCWFVIATGLQVAGAVNLSGSSMRLIVWGR
jgi:hypothetical protein